MYLQITTKCNFHCPHCCYSCTMRGKHGDYSTILDAISYAVDFTESITIGGGEPTMHPRFFDILEHCLDRFDYVWMATNGSQTGAMRRLANIIDGCDYDSFECDCSEEDQENGYCNCADLVICQEDKLTVSLSLDKFHDPIDPKIKRLWEARAGNSSPFNHTGFEVRNVAKYGDDRISAQGRAKKNGYWSDHCVCADIIIKPDGKLRPCGCIKAPVIGDIWNGIEDKWQEVLDSDAFRDENCWTAWKKAHGGR
jgi:MoaA/NifB/PqqE/SkfB family radical SAM enzyme